MRASFTRDDHPHGPLVEAIILTELGKVATVDPCSVRGNDGEWFLFAIRHGFLVGVGRGFSKIRMVIAFWEAITTWVTSLMFAVNHVVGLSAMKQMIDPNASRIIAMMKNIEPRTGRPVQLVTVGVPVRAILDAVDRCRSIARAVDLSGPVPARFGFFDLLPKFISRHLFNLSQRCCIYNYLVLG